VEDGSREEEVEADSVNTKNCLNKYTINQDAAYDYISEIT